MFEIECLFPLALPSRTSSGEGLCLTINPFSRLNTDTWYHWLYWPSHQRVQIYKVFCNTVGGRFTGAALIVLLSVLHLLDYRGGDTSVLDHRGADTSATRKRTDVTQVGDCSKVGKDCSSEMLMTLLSVALIGEHCTAVRQERKSAFIRKKGRYELIKNVSNILEKFVTCDTVCSVKQQRRSKWSTMHLQRRLPRLVYFQKHLYYWFVFMIPEENVELKFNALLQFTMFLYMDSQSTWCPETQKCQLHSMELWNMGR